MTATKKITFLASLLVVASALGQGDRVCMGGNVEQLSAAQLQVCQSQVEQVRDAAAQFHTPGWHFIVVCDESGWKDYAAFSEKPAAVLANASADTDLSQRTTFLRGSRLTEQLAPRVLAVEMAAIVRHNSPGQVASLQ
jgi:hypothetical protein